jgi:hypothetical protein
MWLSSHAVYNSKGTYTKETDNYSGKKVTETNLNTHNTSAAQERLKKNTTQINGVDGRTTSCK